MVLTIGALGSAVQAGGVGFDGTIASGSAGNYAWARIDGSTLGSPGQMELHMHWEAKDNGPGNEPSLYLYAHAIGDGDLEEPSMEQHLSTRGGINLDRVTVEVLEDDWGAGWEFNFTEAFSANMNAGYDSNPPGSNEWGVWPGWGGMWADLSTNIGNIIPDPQFDLDFWNDLEDEEPWFWNDYHGDLGFSVEFPFSSYTATAVTVPEPATLALMAFGGAAAVWRRRRRLM